MNSVPQTVIQAQANLVTAQRALEDVTLGHRQRPGRHRAQDGRGRLQEGLRLPAVAERRAVDPGGRIKYVGGQQIPEINWRQGLRG